jgi:hypothetical protein
MRRLARPHSLRVYGIEGTGKTSFGDQSRSMIHRVVDEVAEPEARPRHAMRDVAALYARGSLVTA